MVSAVEQRIEHYRGLKWIVSGGPGTVCPAVYRDTSQSIAPKVLQAAPCGDRGHVERFRHEASLPAPTDRPDLVNCFDVGQDRDQHAFARGYCPRAWSSLSTPMARCDTDTPVSGSSSTSTAPRTFEPDGAPE